MFAAQDEARANREWHKEQDARRQQKRQAASGGHDAPAVTQENLDYDLANELIRFVTYMPHRDQEERIEAALGLIRAIRKEAK